MKKLQERHLFDSVYDQTCSQEEIFESEADGIIKNVVEGYNGTIYAYGQTGTGKTHTIQGTETNEGILPRAFTSIFSQLKANKYPEYLVRVTYIEVYSEEIIDLLSKSDYLNSKLALKEKKGSGVYVEGLSSTLVSSPEELNQVLQIGNQKRNIYSTCMGAVSSRSILIFSIIVETMRDNRIYIVRKLNFVDLAGSERTNQHLNLSMTTFRQIIRAFSDKNQYITDRNSKLTRLLQDSLGEKDKTLLIVNIGPADYNYAETLTTLRYTNSVRYIQNKPSIIIDTVDSMLREIHQEIARIMMGSDVNIIR